MRDVADDLSRLVDETVPRLLAIGEQDSLRTRGPGTWSCKQILGHLVDSALNNLHRFVRAPQTAEFTFPGYEQERWVAAGGYQDRPWGSLVELWAALNRQAAHVMVLIPEDRLSTPCRIGESQPVTLEFIVRDYPRHMRHHLLQIFDPAAAAGRTHVS